MNIDDIGPDYGNELNELSEAEQAFIKDSIADMKAQDNLMRFMGIEPEYNELKLFPPSQDKLYFKLGMLLEKIDIYYRNMEN